MAGATVPTSTEPEKTERTRQTKSIFSANDSARDMVLYSPLWEFWYSADGTLEVVSNACETCCGYEAKHFYRNSRFMEAILIEEHLPLWYGLWRKLDEGENYATAEFQIRLPDSKKRWMKFEASRALDSDGCYCGIRAFCHDITSHRSVVQQLMHFTWHDSLTKLPNRSKCIEKIKKAISRAQATGHWNFSIVYIDIDRFKNINDSLGHEAGDAILCKLADRLRDATYGFETVFRIGGDEFVLIYEDTSDHQSVHRSIEALIQGIKRPIAWNNKQIHMSASFGIMHGEMEVDTPERYLQNAHVALNHGRSNGTDGVTVYDAQIFSNALKLISMELDLHNALINQEFFLVYQPVVDTITRAVTGFEALIRWKNSQGKIISPTKFIPLAEETGLILQLGEWVLLEACSTLAEWRRTNPLFKNLKVNVNLSARQLSDLELTDIVSRILTKTNLPPECLRLEVTETMLMENPDYADITLRRLRALGVGLCIDDFGTGYSSLMYLQQFPISNLKIDRSFVNDMEKNPANYEIVKAVVALAHALGLTVVAEGVEEEEQRIMLLEAGCDFSQGYLFSRPIPPQEIPNIVSIMQAPQKCLPQAG
ncbi:putative bifunctional diguanylate cyclase/phosphodiesterase [Halodesulfovibrio marinisediminis]|uniref:Diguanylate cyclase (GGDEF) domain-containing protein n=1 Tax=Halodesulfovibrio marinisediminis DSM 17456 TaxID=1121457 RepID=A0A1N6J6B4_9BACT|nr:GGDEF domain-containing protein [Halodesulfovibrio marinisediminis]SIO39837.1 diguanylate cyclase (GGDEF) domain-containing protein [Halodesulfovibrio marinisediminis DSM 17456]